MTMPTPEPTRKSAHKPRLYRGLTPQQLAAERRARLLKAGLELFGEQGYANAPIELICATAKVATRHFYDQFDGREALLRALFDDIATQLSARIAAALAIEARALSLRVSDAIYVAVSFLLEDSRRAQVICVEAVGVSTEMEQYRRKVIHEVAGLVRDYAAFLAETGELPQRDYRLSAVGVAGMIIELMVEWLVNDTGLSADDIAREAVILLRAMIAGARTYERGAPLVAGD